MTHSPSTEKRANQILRGWIKSGEVRCDCGGPSYGTDHSPDCAWVLAWDEALDEAVYEEEYAEAALPHDAATATGMYDGW